MKRQYDDHKKRVKEAKGTIDLGKPPDMPMSMRREIERVSTFVPLSFPYWKILTLLSFSFFFSSQRRVQNAIEKDNRLLLDRLAIAMSRKNIDNELKVKPFTSYIELQRKRELQKICTENRVLLGRIQNTVPSYKYVEWERDAEKRIEYLKNMTEFPDHFVPPVTMFSESHATSSSHGKQRGTRGNSNSPSRTDPSRSQLQGGVSNTGRMGLSSLMGPPTPVPLPPPGFAYDPMIQSELELMESIMAQDQAQQLSGGGSQSSISQFSQQQQQQQHPHPYAGQGRSMRNNTLPPLDR